MILLKGVLLSFYSRDFYYQVARLWRGIGMGYILLLTVFMSLSVSVLLVAIPQVRHAIHELPAKAATLPAITMTGGRLSIDKPVPYRINLGDTPGQMAWIVVDTNYKITDISALEQYMRQNNVIMLATAERMVTRKDKDTRLEITEFKDNESFSITHDTWKKLAGIFDNPFLLMLVSFVVMFLALILGNFILTFFVAIAVFVLGMIVGSGLDFAASMRVASAMRIPVAIISSAGLVISLLKLSLVTQWVIWLGYLVFATWSTKPRANIAG